MSMELFEQKVRPPREGHTSERLRRSWRTVVRLPPAFGRRGVLLVAILVPLAALFLWVALRAGPLHRSA